METTSTDLLGEVVTWDLCAAEISYDLVKQCLADAGLDESAAKELSPRNAFSRACRELKKDRSIDKLKFEHGMASFQFTKKAFSGSVINFDYECTVKLDCDSGKVECAESPELEAQATALIQHAMVTRNAQDVTNMIQRMFHHHADLYPINPRKGVAYFVPEKYRDFTAKVDTFLSKLGGNLARFPVPKGTEHGNASVRDAVQLGLSALLTELNDAVTGWDGTTRKTTIERAEERLNLILYKVDAYQEYLGAEQARLKAEVEEAKKALGDKIMALAPDEEPAAA